MGGHGRRNGLPVKFSLIYAACVKLEPFVAIPEPTLAESRQAIDQNQKLDFCFIVIYLRLVTLIVGPDQKMFTKRP